MVNPVHHLELWTADLATVLPSWDWLLAEIGWAVHHDPDWPQGRTWHHESGVYLVLEQSPDVSGPHDRLRAGLNHLALRTTDREHLDRVRGRCVEHGWSEMFAERYPYAGGPDHVALFIENSEGFEVELVAQEPRSPRKLE